MKKIQIFIAVAALIAVAVTAAAAADKKPNITLYPQSPAYPEGSDAVYECRADGKATYAWHIVFDGTDYDLTEKDSTAPPETDPAATETVESGMGENETTVTETPVSRDYEAQAEYPFADFCAGFSGADGNTLKITEIKRELDGAKVYCTVTLGKSSENTPEARITVCDAETPLPPKLEIPMNVYSELGGKVTVECKSDTEVLFQWFRVGIGDDCLTEIDGANEGIFAPDTSESGIFTYICGARVNEDGPFSYSSPVKVGIVDAKKEKPTAIVIDALPAKTEYRIGEGISLKGLIIRAIYQSGEIEIRDGKGMTFSPDAPSKAGKCKVTVRYQKCAATFSVNVIETETEKIHRVIIYGHFDPEFGGEPPVAQEIDVVTEGVVIRELSWGSREEDSFDTDGRFLPLTEYSATFVFGTLQGYEIESGAILEYDGKEYPIENGTATIVFAPTSDTEAESTTPDETEYETAAESNSVSPVSEPCETEPKEKKTTDILKIIYPLIALCVAGILICLGYMLYVKIRICRII